MSAHDAVQSRDRLVFVEVTPSRDRRGAAEAAGGGIPGAYRAALDAELAAVQGGLPDLEAVGALAALWRGPADRRIVVYARRAEEFPAATRAWLVLTLAGVEATSILDGGLPAWVRAGGSMTDAATPPHDRNAGAAATPRPARREREASIPAPRVLDADDLTDIARLGTLLDARSAVAYHGVMGDPATGHIPGAVHAPAHELLDDDGLLLRPTALRRWLLARRAIGSHTVGAYCGGGIASSALVFAAALVGQEVGISLAAASSWRRDPDRALVQGDGVARGSGADLDCLDESVPAGTSPTP